MESAGLEPGKLNPLAVEVMKEVGIDISHNRTKSAFDLYKQNRLYDYVIAVCDESQAQRCPTFPGTVVTKSIDWSFADPASFQGTWEEKLEKTRQVRNKIKQSKDILFFQIQSLINANLFYKLGHVRNDNHRSKIFV